MKKIREKIKNEATSINQEIKKKIAGYITATFGLVAGFAWNDAIRSSINYFFPVEKNSLWAKFIYAFVITFVLVVVSVYVVKIFSHNEKEEEKK
jgi:uncharacterized membrane protein